MSVLPTVNNAFVICFDLIVWLLSASFLDLEVIALHELSKMLCCTMNMTGHGRGVDFGVS